jgi:hypothetical protein
VVAGAPVPPIVVGIRAKLHRAEGNGHTRKALPVPPVPMRGSTHWSRSSSPAGRGKRLVREQGRGGEGSGTPRKLLRGILNSEWISETDKGHA